MALFAHFKNLFSTGKRQKTEYFEKKMKKMSATF